MVKVLLDPDETVTQIALALEEFEQDHPETEVSIYRYNPGAIRVRIVSPIFTGVSAAERQDMVMETLKKKLPGDTRYEISLLLCLAPDERSLMSLEFEDPSPSQL